MFIRFSFLSGAINLQVLWHRGYHDIHFHYVAMGQYMLVVKTASGARFWLTLELIWNEKSPKSLGMQRLATHSATEIPEIFCGDPPLWIHESSAYDWWHQHVPQLIYFVVNLHKQRSGKSQFLVGTPHYFYGHYKQRTGTSPFLMGQLTISMTMFDSELLVITRLRILQTFAHQLEALAMATVFHSVRCSGPSWTPGISRWTPMESPSPAAGALRSSILQGHGGFMKWGHPQIMYFKRIFHYKPSILGHPHLWNPPNDLPRLHWDEERWDDFVQRLRLLPRGKMGKLPMPRTGEMLILYCNVTYMIYEYMYDIYIYIYIYVICIYVK